MVMKHIKTFEEREWKEDEFQYLLDILNGMMNHAEEILSDYDLWKDDMPVDNVIVDLQEVGTEHSIGKTNGRNSRSNYRMGNRT